MMMMNEFFNKVFISLLISSSALYLAEVNSETQAQSRDCASSLFLNFSSKTRMLYSLTVNDTYFTSDNLTDGVTAMLITTSDGELGIRVMWSIKPEHQDCQFATLGVELNDNEVGKNISVHETFQDFSEASDHLGCNREYTPRVRAVNSGIPRARTESGATLFYGSKAHIQYGMTLC